MSDPASHSTLPAAAQPSKKTLPWEVLLVGALAVLVGLYAFLSLSFLSAQVTALQNQSSDLDARVAGLESLQVRRDAVTLTLLYDSACAACDDPAGLQSFADAFNRQFAQQNTRLALDDVASEVPDLARAGVKSLPVLYLSDADVARSERAAGLVTNPGWVRIAGGYVIDALGLGYGDQGVTVKEMLAINACASPFVAKLEEFSAYACPAQGVDYCRSLYPAVRVVRAKHVTRLDYQFRHFAPDESAPAFLAAQAGECAREQGAFNDFTGRARQSASLDADVLRGLARDAGLDVDAFNACMESGRTASKVRDDTRQATDVYGLAGVPAYVLDCKYVFGAVDADTLEARICAIRPDICVRANETNATGNTSGNATGPGAANAP